MLELGHPRLTHRLQRLERKPDRGRPSQPPQQAPDDQVLLHLRANTAERSSRLAPLQHARRSGDGSASTVLASGGGTAKLTTSGRRHQYVLRWHPDAGRGA